MGLVSFGLFVPARLLRAAKYGGLNLHPSLLPDLRGPAPLHHTVLNNYKVTGVSLQTLDHNAFDCGVVLAQARLKRKLPDYIITTSYLQSLITPAATRLLINGLQKNVHVPPLEFKGWVPPPGYPLRHAPKITKQDRQLTRALLLEFTSKGPPTPERLSHTLLTRRQAALGPLWFLSRDRYGKQKRIIIEAVDDQFPEPPNQEDYEDIDVSMLEGSPWNIPDILVPTTAELGPWQFVIPFEEKLEGGAQPQTQENGSPGEDITPKNLMFWAPYESSRGLKSAFPAGDDDALYLGKYRIVSLKVEGHGARPTRHALHSFIINTEEWRTYHERRDYLEKLREKAEPDNSNSGTLK
ncbi:hypothetical protein RRF57_010296 [Xylaria bambusicola]|uniref:Formyl transferase N-terminal domain-containing protein n=1 Tax=Xylaria bambusicola TaxID=326684 RepID=A0AAN7ZCX4_9PEZI